MLTVNIGTVNMKTRRDSLCAFADATRPAIIALQETQLAPGCERDIPLSNYSAMQITKHRAAGSDDGARGVSLFARWPLVVQELFRHDNAAIGHVFLPRGLSAGHVFASVYVPVRAHSKARRDFLAWLAKTLERIRVSHPSAPCFIMGDWNMPASELAVWLASNAPHLSLLPLSGPTGTYFGVVPPTDMDHIVCNLAARTTTTSAAVDVDSRISASHRPIIASWRLRVVAEAADPPALPVPVPAHAPPHAPQLHAVAAGEAALPAGAAGLPAGLPALPAPVPAAAPAALPQAPPTQRRPGPRIIIGALTDVALVAMLNSPRLASFTGGGSCHSAIVALPRPTSPAETETTRGILEAHAVALVTAIHEAYADAAPPVAPQPPPVVGQRPPHHRRARSDVSAQTADLLRTYNASRNALLQHRLSPGFIPDSARHEELRAAAHVAEGTAIASAEQDKCIATGGLVREMLAAKRANNMLEHHRLRRLLRGHTSQLAPLYQPTMDAHGVMHTDPATIADLQQAHWRGVLSPPDPVSRADEEWAVSTALPQLPDCAGISGEEVPPIAEFLSAMCSLRPDSASGLDGIPTRLLAHAAKHPAPAADGPPAPGPAAAPPAAAPAPVALAVAVASLTQAMWRTGIIPPSVNQAELVVIPKDGKNPAICSNLRPISVTSAIYRVAAKVVANRLMGAMVAADLLPPEQNAYMPDEECMAQACVVFEISQRRQALGLDTYMLAADIEKAFDGTNHSLLFHVLRRLGSGGTFLRFVQGMYATASVAVRVGTGHTERFPVTIGVRQGCPASAPFFIAVAASLLRDVAGVPLHLSTPAAAGPAAGGGAGGGGAAASIRGIQYADDTIALAVSATALATAATTLHSNMAAFGFGANASKSYTMAIPGRAPTEKLQRHRMRDARAALSAADVTLGPRPQGAVPSVTSSIHLGVHLSDTMALADALSTRTAAMLRSVNGCYHFLGNQQIPLNARVALLRGEIMPIGSWSGEVWGGLPEKAAAMQAHNRALHHAVAILALGHKLPSSMQADAAALELGLPPMHAAGLGARARAQVKFVKLRSLIAHLAADCRSRVFATCWSAVGLDTIDRLLHDRAGAWRTRPMAEAKAIGRRVRDAATAAYYEKKLRAPTGTLLTYDRAQFRLTNSYVPLADRAHLIPHSAAVTWLFRARTGMYLTPPRLTHMRKIARVFASHCPSCGRAWDPAVPPPLPSAHPHPVAPPPPEDDDDDGHVDGIRCYAHMLLVCPEREEEVTLHIDAATSHLLPASVISAAALARLTPVERCTLLLGGTISPARLTPQRNEGVRNRWLTTHAPLQELPSSLLPRPAVPIFILVAHALAIALPTAAYFAAHEPLIIGDDGTT